MPSESFVFQTFVAGLKKVNGPIHANFVKAINDHKPIILMNSILPLSWEMKIDSGCGIL